MKYRLDVEVDDNEISFAENFFKSIRFIKKIRAVAPNEITNPSILKSIDAYEKGNEPTPLSLTELKAMLNA